jgi:hypothetical protein
MEVAPIIAPLREAQWSYDRIAAEFKRRAIPLPRGGAWRGAAVWKLHRLASAAAEALKDAQ